MPVVAPVEEQQLAKISVKKILYATDFSEVSRRALSYAVTLARQYGAGITIVHALAEEPRGPVPLETLPRALNRPLQEAEEQMQRVAESVQLSEIPHSTVIAHGAVWDVLSTVIEQDGIDLLVLGTHGRGGVSKLVLGSVAEEVLRRAICPVLTIGKNVEAAGLGCRNILYATDFGPAATRALPYAVSLAEEYAARLLLLHLVPPAPALQAGLGAFAPTPYALEEVGGWQDAARRSASQKLHELPIPEENLAYRPEYVVAGDYVPEGILQAAVDYDADLLVMGAYRTPAAGATAHLPWTLVHAVIARAECPVLTVAG